MSEEATDPPEETQHEMVAQLLQIVGSLSEMEAAHYLSAANWNMEMAADLAILGLETRAVPPRSHSTTNTANISGPSDYSNSGRLRQSSAPETTSTVTNTTNTTTTMNESPAEWRSHAQNGSIHRITSMLIYLLSFLGIPPSLFYRFRAQDMEPRNFSSYWEQHYSGHPCPIFTNGTYDEAIVESRSSLRHLLVYLHSELHGEADNFCLEVLGDQAFTDYLEEHNILFYAQTISNADGLNAAQKLNVTAYPFLCLHVPTHTTDAEGNVPVSWKYEGAKSYEGADSTSILSELKIVINVNNSAVSRVRRNREDVETSRKIREEQDVAYEESLREDEEKERIRAAKEDEERRVLVQEEAKRSKVQKMRAKRKEEGLLAIGEEPEKAAGDTTRICFRLGNGDTKVRIFNIQDPVSHLYSFMDSVCDINGEFDFEIVNSLPRRVFARDDIMTLGDMGLSHSATVFVQDRMYAEANFPE